VFEELLTVFNCSVLTFWSAVSSIANRTPEYVTLLFNPQVIHEYGEPLWNNIESTGKTDSPTRALWQSYQQSSGSKQVKQAKGMMNLTLRSMFVHTWKRFFTCRKILRLQASGFNSPRKEGVLRILSLLKIHFLGRF
jgi:hypothetical protein